MGDDMDDEGGDVLKKRKLYGSAESGAGKRTSYRIEANSLRVFAADRSAISLKILERCIADFHQQYRAQGVNGHSQLLHTTPKSVHFDLKDGDGGDYQIAETSKCLSPSDSVVTTSSSCPFTPETPPLSSNSATSNRNVSALYYWVRGGSNASLLMNGAVEGSSTLRRSL